VIFADEPTGALDPHTAAGAVTLLAVTRAATGSWVPFVPFGPAAGLAGAVAVLTLAAVMIPFLAMARREPTVAAG
jgi:ABC-type dipeptide/oligopeptide/nickel transport system ATPase component